MENKKYHISEFIENENLVIKCDDLEQARKVGPYLWPSYDSTKFNIYNFPIICWYSKKDYSFNVLKDLYSTQIPINFEDVILKDFPVKWCIKDCEEVSKWLAEIYKKDLGPVLSGDSVLTFTSNNYKELQANYSMWDVRDTELIKSSNEYTEVTIEQWRKHFNINKPEENYDYLIPFIERLNNER